MKRMGVVLFVLIVVMILAACQGKPKMEESLDSAAVLADKPADVEVSLINQEGVEIGMALLKERKDGVEINVEASHLPPGLHGFHVHEKGVCEGATFESAGGHYNPAEKEHGFDNVNGPHKGDLHNIETQVDGTINQAVFSEWLTLEKGASNSVFTEAGTALVIHADPDDYTSQPAGNAGERIVCGVISEPGKE